MPGKTTKRSKKSSGPKGEKKRKNSTKKAVTASMILAWEDDPGATPKPAPVARVAPNLKSLKMPVRIAGNAVKPARYEEKTAQFRYWTAADALSRAVDLWSSILPAKTKWQTGKTLPVHLDGGTDLNAFYSRGEAGDPAGLSFFMDTVNGTTVYSGESPDVVTHELGHAVLDAIRPELWDVASVEAAAFHESFGDMSAVLTALQLRSMRDQVLEETRGKVFRSSRVSRLAEQLGWALRQANPVSAESDCLRNAVNSFFYRDPATLPPAAPANLLSSEPHSFSRVFTAAFVEMLAGIFLVKGKGGDEAQLLEASLDAARILVEAIAAAPIVPEYYSQVAAHCVEADAKRFKKKYRDVIKGAFVRRGILSVETATKSLVSPKSAGTSAMAAIGATTDRRAVELQPIEKTHYGLGEPLFVAMSGGSRRYDVAPSKSDVGSIPPMTRQQSTEGFLEDLFRRGRIDMREAKGDPDAMLPQPFIRKTHVMRREDSKLTLRRRMFDCGLD